MADTKEIKLKMIIEAVKNTGSLPKVQAEFAKISSEARKAGDSTKQAGQQGSAGMKKVELAAKAAAARMAKLNSAASAMLDVGLRLAGIGVAMTGAFVFPVASAAKFQDAMAEVVAVTTGAAENYAALSKKAEELGRTTRYTAVQAAQGMAFLGRAGFSAVQVIDTIGPALQLAAAGQLELAEAADIASNVLSAFQLEVSALGHVADVLAQTAASSNTSVRQLGEAMSYAAPAAAAAGISMDETAAAIGVLGNNGIQASSAGTAMRGMLIALAAPTNQAKTAFKELGVVIEKQADGSIDLLGTLQKLGTAQMNLGQATAIFRRTGAAAALALSKQVEAAKNLTAANIDSAGAAKDMAFIMENTLGGAMRRLLAAVSSLVKAFGSPLLAPIQAIIDAFALVIGAASALAQKFPVLSGIITGVVGAFGVLTLTVGGLLLVVAASIKLFTGLRAAMSADIIIQATTALRGYTSAQGLANLVTVKFKNALIWLGRVIKTHPLLFIVGALMAVYNVYQLFANKTTDLIEKTKEHRKAVEESASVLNKQINLVAMATEGSVEQADASKKLRTELLKIVETNDVLAEAALKAAQSINEQSGAIRDDSKAIKEFRDLQFAETIKALTDEMNALAASQKEVLTTDAHGLAWHAWNGIKEIVGATHETVDEFGKSIDATRARIENMADKTVKGLVDMGRVDPSINMAQFSALLDGMGIATDETRIHFIRAFTAIRKEFLDSQKEQIDVVGKTTAAILPEITKRVSGTVAELARLSSAYENFKAKAEATPGDPTAQVALSKAYFDRFKIVEQLESRVRLLAQTEIKGASEARAAALANLETQKARAEITPAKSKEGQLQIEVDYQKAVVAARQHAVDLFKQAGASEVDAAKTVAELLVGAKEDQVAAETNLDNKRAAAAVKARKNQLQKEKALQEAQVDLVKGSIDRELQTLKDGYDAGVVDLDDYLSKRRDLTLAKTAVEIAAIKKQIESAVVADKPVLEIKLKIKEGESAALLAALDAQDVVFRRQQIVRANETEAQILGLKKASLADNYASLVEEQAIEMDLFNLQTENLLSQLSDRKASEDQIKEAAHLRDVTRAKLAADQEEASLDARLDMTKTFTGSAAQLFSDLYDLTGKKTKEFFILSKAAAVAQTAISTAQAVMKAWGQGGMFGAAMAAVIAAQGAANIAKIVSTNMAGGGEVKGGSGRKDDVPIMATGGEFMQPKGAVSYYGDDVMEAIRRKKVPRSLFAGLSLPKSVRGSIGQRNFAEGGSVQKGRAAPSRGDGSSGGEITIINVTDTRELDSYLATPRGQDAVLNILSSRSLAVRRIIR